MREILFIVLFVFEISNCIAGDKRSLVSRVVTSGPTKRFVEKGLTKTGFLYEGKDYNNGDQYGEPKGRKKKIILTDRQLAEEEKQKVESKLEKVKKEDYIGSQALTAEKVLLEGFIIKDVDVEKEGLKVKEKQWAIDDIDKKLERFGKKLIDPETTEGDKSKIHSEIENLNKQKLKLEKEKENLEERYRIKKQDLALQKKDIEKYLEKPEEDDEDGRLKKWGGRTAKGVGLASPVTGGITTGLTGAAATGLFAGAQLLTEEEGTDEIYADEELGGETGDEEAVEGVESTEDQKIKDEQKVEDTTVDKAKDILGSVMQTVAISTATGTQKTKMIEERKEQELKEEAAEKKSIRQAQDERKKKEKAKKEKKAKLEKEKAKKIKDVDKKELENNELMAKQELSKIITLPEGMKLSQGEAESLLKVVSTLSQKTLKKASRLFEQETKPKTFITASGEVVGLVGKDFSEKYLDKYNTYLDSYKKARDKYKELLKLKKSGDQVNEKELAEAKQLYKITKDQARNALIEKNEAIKSKALYYSIDGKGSAWNVVKEGVAMIKGHTPENFEKIKLIEIFKFLKPLKIEQKDLLSKPKIDDSSQKEADIEKELMDIDVDE